MRKSLGWIVRVLAIGAALLATVQPVLGSFAWFRGGDPVNYDLVHLIVGGILYNVALLLVILTPFTRLRWRWVIFGTSVAQYGLLHLQLLLGLNSNDSPGLLAYHIPVGVLIFFLAYLTVVLSFGLRFQTSEA